MARVGAPLPHHAALGPLDDVLARAAAPEPEARLDAAGLAAAASRRWPRPCRRAPEPPTLPLLGAPAADGPGLAEPVPAAVPAGTDGHAV